MEAYAKAIEQCGRPMILSLSPGGDSNVKYLDTYKKSNMVRTTHDIWDEQLSLDR
jgi:alpha-galactosidase